MKTEYKYNPPIPYGLHDMRVKRIALQKEAIKLEFEYGYVKLVEPYAQVDGSITIEGVDFDCANVHVQSKWGEYGNFQGEKLRLSEFLKKYDWSSFEIVDELYGYNQVLYSGYLIVKGAGDLIEMDISIYFTGNIIYETAE